MDTLSQLHVNKNPNPGDVSTNVTGTLKTYLDNGKKEDDVNEKLGRLDQVHRLREVRIRARKPESPPYKDQGMYKIPDGHANRTYEMNIPENAPILALYLQGQLQGVKFTYIKEVGAYMPNVQVFLDGRKLQDYDVEQVFNNSSLDAESIARIDVVLGDPKSHPMSALLGGPSILIYTKRDYIRKSYNPSIANIAPKGFNKVREFYSPRYDRPGNADKLPDLRTTVYWNPYIKTDATGKTTFNFFNADGPGTYCIVVEGINAVGELGRQVLKYTVE